MLLAAANVRWLPKKERIIYNKEAKVHASLRSRFASTVFAGTSGNEEGSRVTRKCCRRRKQASTDHIGPCKRTEKRYYQDTQCMQFFIVSSRCLGERQRRSKFARRFLVFNVRKRKNKMKMTKTKKQKYPRQKAGMASCLCCCLPHRALL